MSRDKRRSSRRSTPHRRRYTRQRALGYVAALLIVVGLILGDRMGVELYLAAIVAFGVRLFNNLAIVRRIMLDIWRGVES